MAQKSLSLQQLQELLNRRLKTARSVAVLGVGSELRGDDAVGMRVAELLALPEHAHPRIQVHFGSTAPESATGPIRVQQPSHLILVDAAALGLLPGQVTWLERADIGGITFCTHALPLSVVIDYIEHSSPGLDVFVLAVQAEHMLFGEPLSPAVEATAHDLVKALVLALQQP